MGLDIALVYPADLPCLPQPEPALAPATDPSPVAFGEGLLWKIEGQGIQPAYLFGTIHLEDTRVTRLPAAVQEVFNRSNSLITEVELHPLARARYSERMRLPPGEALQQHLEAPLYRHLVQIVREEYAIPESALDNLKPWAVFTLLSRPPPVTGQVLDDLLNTQAVEQGKSVHGLETVDELVSALDTMSLDDQLAILVDTICNRHQLSGQLEELTRLYLHQDVAGMLAINARSHQDEALFARFMERTLYQRNRRMALRIRGWMGEEVVFIAVGALHLAGEKGILRRLQADGYRILRIF
jgi:uncharacterized protein YbaP (TraB family)